MIFAATQNAFFLHAIEYASEDNISWENLPVLPNFFSIKQKHPRIICLPFYI
jgi:hypothetical protein